MLRKSLFTLPKLALPRRPALPEASVRVVARRALGTLGRFALFVLKWAALLALLAFMGLFVGFVVVFLPPLALLGVVGLALVVLLWVMPDINLISLNFLRWFFFVAVIIQLVVPQYYALALPGVAWISLRRTTWLMFVTLAALSLASSRDQRQLVAQRLSGAPLISGLVLFYLLTIILSVFTAASIAQAMRNCLEALLYWYAAFFGALLCIEDHRTVRRFCILLVTTIYISVPMGIYEMWTGKRFLLDILPSSVVSGLFANNPALYDALTAPSIRNGLYRSSFVFFVPLSFGEYLAMCAPVALFLGLHDRSWKIRVIGIFAVLLSLVGIFSTGSRGAYVGAFASLPTVMLCWIIREMRLHPSRLGPMIAAAMTFMAGVAVAALFVASGRLSSLITGGGQGTLSTQARFEQWQMAKPWILSNPVTGHGIGLAADLVGYFSPAGGLPTLDTTIINVLVETGVPGLIAFFGSGLAAALLPIWVYLGSKDEKSESGLAIGCALLSFSIYRLTLSQRENYTFFFVLLGLSCYIVAEFRARKKADERTRTVYATRPDYRGQAAMGRQLR